MRIFWDVGVRFKLPKTGIIKFVNLLIQKWNIVIKLLCDRWTFVTAFFRTIMTRSSTNYRTAMVALTAGDSIREAHSYEYDNNGNIVYVNTKRLKPDMTAQPDTVQHARDKRTVPLSHCF